MRKIHHILHRVASSRKCVDLGQGVARWEQYLGLAQRSFKSLSRCGNAGDGINENLNMQVHFQRVGKLES